MKIGIIIWKCHCILVGLVVVTVSDSVAVVVFSVLVDSFRLFAAFIFVAVVSLISIVVVVLFSTYIKRPTVTLSLLFIIKLKTYLSLWR